MDEADVRRSTRVRAPPRENPALAFRKYINKWKEDQWCFVDTGLSLQLNCINYWKIRDITKMGKEKQSDLDIRCTYVTNEELNVLVGKILLDEILIYLFPAVSLGAHASMRERQIFAVKRLKLLLTFI